MGDEPTNVVRLSPREPEYDEHLQTKPGSAKNERARQVRRDVLQSMRGPDGSPVSLDGYSDRQLRRILSLRLHDESDAEMAQVDYYIKVEIALRFDMEKRNADGRKRKKRKLHAVP